MTIIPKFLLGPPSGERLANNIARTIQKDLRNAAVTNKNFQQAVKLDEMADEPVHDMVQNLTMNGLAMAYLMLDTAVDAVKNLEQRELYSEARNGLVSAYLNLLNGEDAPEDLLPGWIQVLAKKCEDYRKIYRDNKESLPDIKLHNPWVNIAGIGAAVRLRNREPNSADPLPKILINIFGEMSGRIGDCIINELKRI